MAKPFPGATNRALLSPEPTREPSPSPGQSPGVGVLVVTAVVQQLHHGLWGKEREWRRMASGCLERPCPPLSRAQGPHLGGAGQELLLLPRRCHCGDEAQRGQVLPLLLENKRKVVNSTSNGHSLSHCTASQSRFCLWGKARLPSSPQALQGPTSLYPAAGHQSHPWPAAWHMLFVPTQPSAVPTARNSQYLHDWTLHTIQTSAQIGPLRGCWPPKLCGKSRPLYFFLFIVSVPFLCGTQFFTFSVFGICAYGLSLPT